MSTKLSAYDKFRYRYRAWKYRWQTEPAEIGVLLDSIKPGNVCLDIGGHKGAFTYWMRRCVGRDGTVLTFEPQPELASYLRGVAKSLRFDNVHIHEMALSSRTGRATLSRDSQRPSPGATLESADSDTVRQFDVQVESLDRVLAQENINHVDFIKCDAEGHEYDVFLGASRILTSARPIVLFECEQRHCKDRLIQTTFELLESFGYDGHFFRRQKLYPLESFEQQGESPDHPEYVYNFLFRPQSEFNRMPLVRKAA